MGIGKIFKRTIYFFTQTAVVFSIFNLKSEHGSQPVDISDFLKQELGENYQKKKIEDIYLAGPNRTESCCFMLPPDQNEWSI